MTLNNIIYVYRKIGRKFNSLSPTHKILALPLWPGPSTLVWILPIGERGESHFDVMIFSYRRSRFNPELGRFEKDGFLGFFRNVMAVTDTLRK